ncbi:MAG: hypothetical protein V3T14_06375, partial [Myxococcota bacterium]
MSNTPAEPLGSTKEMPIELHGSAARLERYGVLRSAQRALYRIRGLPGRVPGSEDLGEVLQRLRALGAARSEPGGEPEASPPLEEIDRLLAQVADGLRSIALEISFTALRVGVQESRPDEIAALVDLCLEDASELTRFTRLIDYLVTQLCTVFSGPERVLGSDPVRATPRLRTVCARIADYDRAEVEGLLELFRSAISELSQAEEAGELMERMSERKGELGLLMFVPDLFRSIVLYNIVARNRIDDDLEAERMLHKLDLEATLSTLPELVLSREDEPEEEESREPTEGEVPEEGPSEAAEREAIDALSDAISQVAQGEEAGTDAIARIAASLDLSLLSVWERQALTSDEPGQAVLRTVVSVGLLLKKAEELEPALGVLGLSIARLEGHWVPELDTRLQEQITERLM